jgi:hypothetical protein
MTYTLRFLPEVEDDAISGYSWYETKSPGLGEDFLRMFYACAGDIPRNPRRFPYAIYFIIEKDLVVVTGLFHCACDPRVVESRLKGRKE